MSGSTPPPTGKLPGLHRPTGIIAERVTLTCPLDPYMALTALSTYSSISKRKLRDFLKDPLHPLPCYRIDGKILVRRSEYDLWVRQFRKVGNSNVEKIVAEILSNF